MVDVRKGQAPAPLTRGAFGARFRAAYYDPAFDKESAAIARLEEIAWEAYDKGRKAPRTSKAGPGYADPEYDLSVEWIATRARIAEAAAQQKSPTARSRVLVICGASRNDGTCPGEMSKTFR